MTLDSDPLGWHRRTRVLLTGFALASVAVLVAGLFAYRAASQFADSGRLVQRSYAALDSIQEIELRYSRSATAARTYIVSGNPRYLEIYRREVATVQPAIADALRHMNDMPAQREKLGAVIQQMIQRIEMIEGGLRAYAAGGLLAVTERNLSASDRVIEERALATLHQTKEEQEAILAQRIAQDSSRLSELRRMLVLFLVATVVILALLLLRARALEDRRGQAAREYERQRRLLESIVENAPIGIHVKDPGALRLQLVNRVVEEQLGKPREALLGHSDGELYPGPHGEAALAAERELIASRRLHSEEQLQLDTASGRRTLHMRKVLIPDENGRIRFLLGITEDVTDRLAAETALKGMAERLERKRGELEAANKELESFSYSVSHDLRAPLRAVDGFAAMLAEDYRDRLDDEGRRLLGNIRRGATRMGLLIQDLLAFSRLGRQPLTHARVDTRALAQAAWDALRASNPELRAELQLADRLPSSWGDARLLLQVWSNLLENAVKYSSKSPQPLVHVEGTAEGDEAVFHVQDNGVGFDMRYAGKLFEVFQRLHGESEFPGTGVGLAIVHRIVGRHGGRVWAHSEPGQGARFSFALPQELTQ